MAGRKRFDELMAFVLKLLASDNRCLTGCTNCYQPVGKFGINRLVT
jgi:hypothetical protein